MRGRILLQLACCALRSYKFAALVGASMPSASATYVNPRLLYPNTYNTTGSSPPTFERTNRDKDRFMTIRATWMSSEAFSSFHGSGRRVHEQQLTELKFVMSLRLQGASARSYHCAFRAKPSFIGTYATLSVRLINPELASDVRMLCIRAAELLRFSAWFVAGSLFCTGTTHAAARLKI